MTEPKSKAGMRLEKYLKGLDALADSFDLKWVGDDSKPEIKFYLADKTTGKRLHGPFKNFSEVEAKLNSIHLASGSSVS